jgi:glycogen operon protein
MDRRRPSASINFVTCHDGFTLADLVSYNEKHNAANGEWNFDGENNNRSWNCGAEGLTSHESINALRARRSRSLLATLMLSQGVPMLLGGDEVGRTQGGNNNAYCQDNEASWFDWTLVDTHADLLRFVCLLIARRLRRDAEHERQRVSLNTLIEGAEKAWHGVKLFQPDWGDGSHGVALGAELQKEGLSFHLILNAFWEPREFELPTLEKERPWRRWIDTALVSPDDIVPWEEAPPVPGNSYRAEARSVVMLIATTNVSGSDAGARCGTQPADMTIRPAVGCN